MTAPSSTVSSPTDSLWAAMAAAEALALALDFDGTLVPFAATPDDVRPPPELVGLLVELSASPGVTVAVVSGRPKESLQQLFDDSPDLLLVAEHGGWRREGGVWRPPLDLEGVDVASLEALLAALTQRYPGAFVERKTWSLALHYRLVPRMQKDAFLVESSAILMAWLRGAPHFERLDGAEIIEVRPHTMRKSTAVHWLRDRAGPGARVLVVGDDFTDEDMFRAVTDADAAILVGPSPDRATAAQHRLPGPSSVQALLRGVLAVRRGELAPAALEPLPVPLHPTGEHRLGADDRPPELLVVSNRLPELRAASVSAATGEGDPKKRSVGGLVSALEPVLSARRGVWLGWSGRTLPEGESPRSALEGGGTPALAWMDLPERWHRLYYNGFCNSALWPLFHSFAERARFSSDDWAAYVETNEAFAEAAVRYVPASGPIWAHDYHLFLLARGLRARGHTGPLGLFLHIPFPPVDIFGLLPWAEELLEGLLAFDLLGFHTRDFADNFIAAAARLLPGRVRIEGQCVLLSGHTTRVGVFPIGIIPEGFQEPPEPDAQQEVEALMRAIAASTGDESVRGRLVLGVDRLDYTKGIPARLAAFGRLLEVHPEWRRRVSLVQVSVPSRADVAEYAEQKAQVESIVGRVNGEMGDTTWVPIRYLYRSYGKNPLSQLYRAADIGYVTPLRDGMNLVAKEFVAAQDPEIPGVLLLSRFAGAAAELKDAVLTNPWFIDGMAEDLHRALLMPEQERRERHGRLRAVVEGATALTWAEDFVSTLTGGA